MKIEKFAFGSITIDGKTYQSDLIIYPDGTIEEPWWRKSSHILAKEDIDKLTKRKPDMIIVGTGINGFMRPERGLAEYITSQGIEFIAVPNEKAVEMFNKYFNSNKKIGACFHLTC